MYKLRDLDISDFLKEDPTFEFILRGFYTLNDLDFVIFCSLYQHKHATTKELTDYTNNRWPKNKINASLKRLIDAGLAGRKRENQENGSGYHYVYFSVSTEKIRDEILQTVENWMALAKIELSDLENHLRSYDISAYVVDKNTREKIREEWFEE